MRANQNQLHHNSFLKNERKSWMDFILLHLQTLPTSLFGPTEQNMLEGTCQSGKADDKVLQLEELYKGLPYQKQLLYLQISCSN